MYKTASDTYRQNCLPLMRKIQQMRQSGTSNDEWSELVVLLNLGFKNQEQFIQNHIEVLINTITNKCNKYTIKYNPEKNKQVGRFSVLNYYTNEVLYRATSRSLAKYYCERNNLNLVL